MSQLHTLVIRLGLMVLPCALAFFAVSSVWAGEAPTPNLAADMAAWGPRDDGGNAPRIISETSIQTSGHPALKLSYVDSAPHWGSVERKVSVPPHTRAIFVRIYLHRTSREAALHLWLIEPDGDRWSQQLFDGGKPLGEMSEGWHDLEAPVGDFKFDGSGKNTRGMADAEKLVVGCNYGSFEMSITDLRFVLAGETPGESPAVLPPPSPEDGEKGRVAILSENFVVRKPDETLGQPSQPLTEEEKKGSPSASDPEWLAELARRAGYGVTLLSASALSSPGYLSSNTFDVLIIPCAPCYPLSGARAIQSFLASGGALFTTGGYAFDKPCVRAGEGWQLGNQALTVEDVDHGTQPVNLNHRYGIPGDGKGPSPDEVPLFDPANPLLHAAYAESAVDFIPKVRLDGPFQGWAASALLGSNDPVRPKPYARRISLLAAKDSLGREAGALGAIIHNYDGPYKGSSWAAFGVTNADLFSRTGPLSMSFTDILDRLVHKTYIHTLKTDLALYRPGETATLSVMCANFDKAAAHVWAQFEILGQDGMTVAKLDPVEKDIPSGFQDRLESVWTLPPAISGDFYTVRCQMTTSDRQDQLETAFCVDNPAARHAGVPITFRDNYFCRAGKPVFLLGTNQTGAVFVSAFEDPLVWKKDLDGMRSNGLSIMRVLHFSPFVTTPQGSTEVSPMDLAVDRLPRGLERKLDALVQMTAQHGVALLLTLHDWMGVDLTDKELAAQTKFAHLIAARYADCPHVIYDIQNEPIVQLNRQAEDTALWNQFLKERYHTQATLAAAWGTALKEGEKLGSVALDAGPDGWTNARAQTRDLFRAWLVNRWAKVNVEGVHEASKALVTVGFIQNTEFADQMLGTEWLDFVNKHYYGAKGEMAHELKFADRRFEGKSFALGEFGSLDDQAARVHGISRDAWDCDWFLEAAGTTMGLGGSFILNWCWKEMPDCAFPWGLSSPIDMVPRDTLLGFRAFALATRPFSPRYVPPAVWVVSPDYTRMGGGWQEETSAVKRSLDAGMRLRTDFGVINESSLAKLPAEARLLILPAPYALSDEAWSALEAFVKRGGTLYASGDITFDTARRRTRTERMKLFGLEFVKELTPPMAASADASGKVSPGIEVRAAGAKEIAPGLWENQTGAGRTVFNTAPVELFNSPVDLYLRLAEIAGVQRAQVTPADPELLALNIPGQGEGDRVFFLMNRTNSAKDCSLPGGVAMRLEADGKALLVEKGGRPVSLIARGEVAIAGKPWVELGALTAVVSLDGQPLDESRQLAVCPLGAGEVRLDSFKDGDAPVLLGEVREAAWVTLGTRTPQRAGDILIIPAETELSYTLMVVAPKAQQDQAANTVASLLSLGGTESK